MRMRFFAVRGRPARFELDKITRPFPSFVGCRFSFVLLPPVAGFHPQVLRPTFTAPRRPERVPRIAIHANLHAEEPRLRLCKSCHFVRFFPLSIYLPSTSIKTSQNKITTLVPSTSRISPPSSLFPSLSSPVLLSLLHSSTFVAVAFSMSSVSNPAPLSTVPVPAS